jgi:rhamnosyltransferase
MTDNVCAVVVTYFPDAGLKERLERIAAQVSGVIVVDNGTTGESLTNLEQALGAVEKVVSIRNGENLGIAAALNQGIRRALGEQGKFSWVATFDQDSLPAGDMVEKMLSVWKAYPYQEKLMIAGPRTAFVDSTASLEPSADRPWREVTHVITSGSLIARQAFSVAGYYNESLFIDYVDIEYCLRLRTLGFHVIEALTTEISHHMGSLEERILFERKIHPTHHPPLRRYYQFRNALLLHRQFRYSQRSWRRRNRVILMKILVLILLYEKRRLQSLFQILRGIVHGLAGRSGRHGETLYMGDPMEISRS